MNERRLILRSLWHHRRGNLAVLLGVAIGTAVMSGALLVGDSLRGSLRDRALAGLGWVDHALVAPRFFRKDRGATNTDDDSGISLRATVSTGDGERRTSATIWAMQNDFVTPYVLSSRSWLEQKLDTFQSWFGRKGVLFELWRLSHSALQGEAWINPALSQRLGIAAGDELQLQFIKPSTIPRESLLGRRDRENTTGRFTVRIAGVLKNPNPTMPVQPFVPVADFSLAPSVEPPANIFVDLPWLQQMLGVGNRVNVLLAGEADSKTLNANLATQLNLDDWGLVIRTPASRTEAMLESLDRTKDGRIQPNEWRGRLAEVVAQAMGSDADRTLTAERIKEYFAQRGYVSLESKQMLLEPAVERAALEAAAAVGLKGSPTLIYLANSIGDGKATIPYSIVAAMDVTALPAATMKDDEILLAEWAESPLGAKPGDTIVVSYFEPEMEGRVQERSATFRLRGFVPMTGLAADPDLAPEFPGITDKLDLKEWDPPFPYDNKRIQLRDDEYWAKYRTTPKAYITPAAGQKLFGSRFGQVTSIRLSMPDGRTPDDAIVAKFEKALLSSLDPAAGGFVFQGVRAQALAASTGGQDFGMLFLGFSFFLIATALILVGLLVRLNWERRASEIGLLLSAGFNTKQVRRVCVRESLIVSVFGIIVGTALAVGYAALMLRLLAALWPDGSVGSLLTLHVGVLSLVIGTVTTLAISWLAIRWALRSLRRVPPSALLAGVAAPIDDGRAAKPRRSAAIAVVALVGAVALLVAGRYVRGVETRALAFFGGGALLLIAFLAGAWAWMRRSQPGDLRPGRAATMRLGARSVLRNPTRSLLTATLLASAAFLLVAVEAFRRSPDADFAQRNGGSGGFALVAETDRPIFTDPQSPEGRQELLDNLEKRWLQRSGATPEQVRAQLAAAQQELADSTIIPLRRQTGDDASCLNLYQPGQPRIAGVPPTLVNRGGFRFAGSEGERDNPWKLLETARDDGAIPAIGEAHTVQWMLKSGLGGTVTVRDGNGNERSLRIVALLKDSVFQGELLIADAAFRSLFPRDEGFSQLLIDPAGHDDRVRELLQQGYADDGIEIAGAKQRVDLYLQVENTYLSTFQVLGGFGLLLGTLGLAAVLLRNVWERRREFAVLRAVGYRQRILGGMILVENAVLVLFGVLVGVVAALIALVPSGADVSASTPWLRLTLMLAAVLACGLSAGLIAVRSTARAPIVLALRHE